MKTYRFVSSITKNFLENFLVYLQGSNFWLELKLYDPISLEVSSYGLKLKTQPEAIDERKYTFQGMLKHLKHNDGRIVEVMGCLKFNESDGIDMLLTDISFSNNFLNFREVIENLSLSRTAFLVKAVEYYKEENIEYFQDGNMKKNHQLFRNGTLNKLIQLDENRPALFAMAEIFENIFPLFSIGGGGLRLYGYGTFIEENKVGILFQRDYEALQFLAIKKKEELSELKNLIF